MTSPRLPNWTKLVVVASIINASAVPLRDSSTLMAEQMLPRSSPVYEISESRRRGPKLLPSE